MTLSNREQAFSKIHAICEKKINATLKSIKYFFYTKVHWDTLLAFIFHFHWKSHSQTDLCWHLEYSCGEEGGWKDRMGKII